MPQFRTFRNAVVLLNPESGMGKAEVPPPQSLPLKRVKITQLTEC
jgi:hypothetical protein